MGPKLARINKIEQYIVSHGVVSLDELCAAFQVSKNTLRRDLNTLITRGNITKVYGGVKSNLGDNLVPMPVRSAQRIDEKRYIGELAAQLVDDGDTIFVDSGTTAVQIIPHVAKKKRITVIAHSLTVLDEAARYESISLIGLGGIYSQPTHSFVGAVTLESIKNMRISKAFMATTAVSLDVGMMNTTMFEAEIKRGIIANSEKVYLMVDTSKFDTRALLPVCPLERVDCLITNARPPEAYLAFFAAHDHRVLY